jgi:NAD(P)-dependent dehydrogenase (short-subunit alcohol dehydrogenase family)
MSPQGVKFLALDPGDMDTPMHALAMPDADRAALKQPSIAAGEIADAIADLLPVRLPSAVRRAS